MRLRARERGMRRSSVRRFFELLGVVLLFAVVALAAAILDESSMHTVAGQVRVIDGDTLRIAGERIRLAGIDAPETGQTCRIEGLVSACGQEAGLYLAELTREGNVSCRGNERDRYGRLLARCVAGETDINSAMVRAGWAVAYGDYAGEQNLASREKIGLWAGAFDMPSDWRAVHGAMADIGPASLAMRLYNRLLSGLFDNRGEETE